MIEFKVLGALGVVDGAYDCTPSAPKPRQVLAVLLMHANQVVPVTTLIEEIWGADPPRSAKPTALTYAYHLRKLFAGERPEVARMLRTRPPGYLFAVEPQRIDANVFRRLVQEGRLELERGRPGEAARLLGAALGLWSGPVLADVAQGEALRAQAVALEELRQRALELRIQADFQMGMHRELIGELRSLVTLHPLNEWFHGRLIDALGRAGRRHEALCAYRDLRTVLHEELGLEPAPELQRLQRQLLTAGDLAGG
jgi:SARP family transcriptional regulator, regulator of embCAB operon